MSEPFCRVYHDKFAREFPAIWSDPVLLGTWLRLLAAAEKAWPLDPELPRALRPRPVRTLQEAGVVELLPGHIFALRGFSAERQRRAESAKKSADARWHSDGNALASPDAMQGRGRSRGREQGMENEPPPPAERGRRANGTNPRSTGGSPRQAGTAPRQTRTSPRDVRRAEKRGPLPSSTHEILRRAAAAGGDA